MLDAVPELRDTIRLVGLEVLDGLDDGPGQAEHIDRLRGEAALGAELARQLVAVELLDGADDLGGVDPVDVDDLGFHGGLDRVGQFLHRRERVFLGAAGVGTEGDRIAEGDEHPPPEGLPGLEREADRDERQRRPGGPRVCRPRRLVVQRDPRRPRLDALDARLGVRGPLGIDRQHVPRVEGLAARGERVGVPAGEVRAVVPAVHGDRAGSGEETREDRVAEQ